MAGIQCFRAAGCAEALYPPEKGVQTQHEMSLHIAQKSRPDYRAAFYEKQSGPHSPPSGARFVNANRCCSQLLTSRYLRLSPRHSQHTQNSQGIEGRRGDEDQVVVAAAPLHDVAVDGRPGHGRQLRGDVV